MKLFAATKALRFHGSDYDTDQSAGICVFGLLIRDPPRRLRVDDSFDTNPRVEGDGAVLQDF